MQQISYYIVTRFNVRIFDGKISRDKNIRPERDRLNENYLRDRFDFFENHTLQSIKKQTNQNFKWILLFHADTPNIFKERIKRYQQEFSNIEVLYVQDNINANDMLRDYLQKKSATNWIAVARIDNDDEYEQDFMSNLQKVELDLNGIGYVISYPNGIKYDIRKNILWKVYNEKNNCIILFTDKNNKINHSLSLDHTKVADKNALYPLVCIKDSPVMWKVNIHGTNLGNTYRYHIKDLVLNKTEIEKNAYMNISSSSKYCMYLTKAIINGIAHEIWFGYVELKKRIKSFIKCKSI